MANEIATMSRSRLMAGLRSVRSRLSSIRESAEVGAQRLTILGASAGGSYGTGRLVGWAEADPTRDITIGDSTINYTLPIGAGLALLGAFGGKALGETTANVAFGFGMGAVNAELAFMGRAHALAPEVS